MLILLIIVFFNLFSSKLGYIVLEVTTKTIKKINLSVLIISHTI